MTKEEEDTENDRESELERRSLEEHIVDFKVPCAFELRDFPIFLSDFNFLRTARKSRTKESESNDRLEI